MKTFSLQTSVTTLIDKYMLDMFETLDNTLSKVTELYVEDAKLLCMILMFFYLTMQAYILMTGDGKVSLVPLIRPFVFFLIVANWSTTCYILERPLKILDQRAKASFTDVRNGINAKYTLRGKKTDELVKALFVSTEDLKNSQNTLDNVIGTVVDWTQTEAIFEAAQNLSLIGYKLQSRFTTLIQRTIEYVIMLFFKGCVYFVYFIRILLLTVLKVLGPFIFALSVVNAYRDLYLQWISKFVSVGLYGAIAHIAIMLAFLLIDFGLSLDIAFLDQTLADFQAAKAGDDSLFLEGSASIIELYLRPNSGGSSLIIALVTGAIGLLAVPVVATWVLGANSTSAVATKAATQAYNTAKGGAQIAAKAATAGAA